MLITSNSCAISALTLLLLLLLLLLKLLPLLLLLLLILSFLSCRLLSRSALLCQRLTLLRSLSLPLAYFLVLSLSVSLQANVKCLALDFYCDGTQCLPLGEHTILVE